MNRPRLSPALFALICLGFLLPFATVSCDDARTSFTGIQLVTHTVPSGGPALESLSLDMGRLPRAAVQRDDTPAVGSMFEG